MSVSAWSNLAFQELKALDIRQVAYVPDAGHSALIRLCDSDPCIRSILLTTEEEGVAMLAGAWLGGDRGALLLQSSGIGNCINMLSLQQECRIPIFMLVTMRGEWGEFNPWQVTMGQSTPRVLKDSGVIVCRADSADDIVATIGAGGRLAFQTGRSVAVLIGQRAIGAKEFGAPLASQ